MPYITMTYSQLQFFYSHQKPNTFWSFACGSLCLCACRWSFFFREIGQGWLYRPCVKNSCTNAQANVNATFFPSCAWPKQLCDYRISILALYANTMCTDRWFVFSAESKIFSHCKFNSQLLDWRCSDIWRGVFYRQCVLFFTMLFLHQYIVINKIIFQYGLWNHSSTKKIWIFFW